MNAPSSRSSFIAVSLKLAVASLVVAGVGFGLYQWQGWRIPYTQFEVGGAGVNPAAFKALNKLRVQSRRRWWVASGYRSPEHNKAVEGKKGSLHLKGKAFDLVVSHADREAFYVAAKKVGFKGFGWGSNTVHVDIGSRRWWTYDDEGATMSGARRFPYLHKAPENFRRDYNLKLP